MILNKIPDAEGSRVIVNLTQLSGPSLLIRELIYSPLGLPLKLTGIVVEPSPHCALTLVVEKQKIEDKAQKIAKKYKDLSLS